MSVPADGGNRPRVAFLAPMKPPDHPTPSGDRRIARLMLEALGRAGFDARLASGLRTLDMEGSAAAQAVLEAEAGREVERLAAGPRADLVFTYHCYWKAPDLIGPALARFWRVPHVIAEPSLSPRRLEGPWARFAALAAEAIGAARLLLWTTARDRPALEAAGHAGRMAPLPPFLDEGPRPRAHPAGRPLRLLAVAMMRPGDKVESYRRLAATLAALDRTEPGWRLDVIGDGPARAEVEALLAPLGDRVALWGALDDPAILRREMESADLLLWPGIGEGVGMVWLEAMAAGLPVVAADGPAARAVLAPALLPLPGPDDPAGIARAILDVAANRTRISAAVRAHVEDHHGLDAAASRLDAALRPLVALSTGTGREG